MIDPDAVGLTIPPYKISWDSTRAIIYALGVGAGVDELQYTTENSHDHPQAALPTLSVALMPGAQVMQRLSGVDWSRVVHTRQRVVLHRPLSVAGVAMVQERLISIVDKGPGRSAVVSSRADGNHPDGSLMITSEMTVAFRGHGGFGGLTAEEPAYEVPKRVPDTEVTDRTKSDQALLYRLSGDRNPLHSDPWFAREKAGFDRPILHGLCTYGFAARALLSAVCGGDPASFRSMDALFVAPVYPGEELTTRIWRRASGADFQVAAGAEGRIVLDAGLLVLREAAHS